MKAGFYSLAMLLLLIFCWGGLAINNHSEADDAFEYARMAEVENHEWLFHPHHLLYGKTAQCLYRGAQVVGYRGRAYSLLVGFSIFSALALLPVFFCFCRDRYNATPLSALLATGGLAFSYGFWRYAFEAEVLLPSLFLALLSFYLATGSNHSQKRIALAALVSAVAILFHILNGLVAFAAIPFFYLLQRRYRSIVSHLLVSVGIVAAVYALVFAVAPSGGDEGAVHGLSLRLSQVPKGAIGFGQCLVSGNFLFGFDVFSQKMCALFPSRMLSEEVYWGSKASPFTLVFPWITLAGLVCACGLVGWKSVSRWKRMDNTFLSALRSDRGILIAASSVLFLLYSFTILISEPGNPEVWVLGLLPFWLSAAGVLTALFRAKEWKQFLAILLLLMLHNAVGGIFLLSSTEGDYNRMKAQWVVVNASENDRVLTAANPVFIRHLRYHTRAAVVDLNKPVTLFDDSFSGKVFVLGDVFNYPVSMAIRFPSAKRRVYEYAARLKPVAELVRTNEFGGIWVLSEDVDLSD